MSPSPRRKPIRVTGAASFIEQRLSEAERLRDAQAPSYTIVVALQVAIEVYIDLAAEQHAAFGPFPRGDNPHEARAGTARILAACGCIADGAAFLVSDLRKWSGQTRYGDVELHPVALDRLISQVRSVVRESVVCMPSAA